MAPEPLAVAPQPRASLFVEAVAPCPVAGADAVICDAPAEPITEAARGPVIWRCAPGQSAPAGARVCVAEGGLAAAAQLRAAAPAALVVPRAEVQRLARRYSFATESSGSGFSTYHLDPATVAGFEVEDGGRQIALADWLAEATRQGFFELWLHSRDAAAAGLGFAGELLDRAHRMAPETGFWLSGGGRGADDVARIQARPGLAALVLAQAALADPDTGAAPAAT